MNELKQAVYKANLDLVKHGLVVFTWGNVSGIDREKGLVVMRKVTASAQKATGKPPRLCALCG